MISFKILELNRFMAKLLKGEEFDEFLLREGFVKTYMEYRFQGRLFLEYFDAEKQEEKENQEYVLWREVKPFIFELIKGKRTPLAFQFNLLLPVGKAAELLAQHQVSVKEEDHPSLYLQLRFEHGVGRILSGASRDTFSMDKSMEETWDKEIKQMLLRMEIPVEVE